jgi:hypothetical protein
MMATKRQQERKKKAREQKGRARVESRRHKMNEIKRQERRSTSIERKFRDKVAPIVNDPEKKALLDEADKKKVSERLQHNMEILKALEEEYERDATKKKELNERLESEGHITLKDKVNALEASAREASLEGEAGKIDLVSK